MLYTGSEVTFSNCADYNYYDMFVYTVEEEEEEINCIDFVVHEDIRKDHEASPCSEITVTGYSEGDTIFVALTPYSFLLEDDTEREQERFLLNECGPIKQTEENETGVTRKDFGCGAILEVREPPVNDQCSNAITLEPNEGDEVGERAVAVVGTLQGATAQRSPCVDVDLSSAQMVYYSYTSSSEGRSAITFLCSESKETMDVELHILSSCELNKCVERFESCTSFPTMEVEANTEILLAVTSRGFQEGPFSFEIREIPLLRCNPDGPEYECATSFEIETDHMCDGVQCVTITEEDLYLGYCFDHSNCDCEITRVEGPEDDEAPYVTVGMELTAALAHYPVYSIATNEDGTASDICSFRINVNNKCNIDGPELEVREQPIYVSTRASCSLDGERCGIIPPFFIGSCSDNKNCKCEVYQVDTDFIPGAKLTPGTYQTTIGARNELGFESETAQITIIVN